MYPLFPYTTLFRSVFDQLHEDQRHLRQSNDADRIAAGKEIDHVAKIFVVDRKSTRLNSSHRCIHSFPTRRSSDLFSISSMKTSGISASPTMRTALRLAKKLTTSRKFS